jgi:hypothetical protein
MLDTAEEKTRYLSLSLSLADRMPRVNSCVESMIAEMVRKTGANAR